MCQKKNSYTGQTSKMQLRKKPKKTKNKIEIYSTMRRRQKQKKQFLLSTYQETTTIYTLFSFLFFYFYFTENTKHYYLFCHYAAESASQ